MNHRASCILSLVLLFLTACTEKSEEVTTRSMRGDPDNTWTMEALQRGDADAIRAKVLENPDYIHERDYIGDTPLLSAISHGDPALVTFLLENGSDPNVEVDDGYTCLLSAIESDSEHAVEILAELIKAGADIHVPGTNGWTPLHMAAARGKTEHARLLIEAGAEVNRRKEIDASETPLMEAAHMGHPEVVRLLLAHGADAAMRDSMMNRTALEIAREAAKGPDPEVVKQLRKMDTRIDVEAMFADMDLPPDELAALLEAVGDVDMVQSYIDAATEIMHTGNHAEVIRILSGTASK